MTYAEEAEDVYKKRYAGRGLAPIFVRDLKKAIALALRKKESPKLAAREFFKEKGIKLEPPKGGKVGAKKAAAKTDPPKAEKKEKKEEKFEKAKEIDGKQLLATIREVISITGGKKALPSSDTSDEDLRRLAHEAIASLMTPESAAVLDHMKGDSKIVEALGDCVGVFVDMRSADCVRCVDQSDCVKKFAGNLRDGFAGLAKTRNLMTSEDLASVKKQVQEIVQQISDRLPPSRLVEQEAEGSKVSEPPEERERERKPKAAKKKKATEEAPSKSWKTYAPTMILCVMDTDNPMKPGSIEHAFFEEVLREGSMTISEMEKIHIKVFGGEQRFDSKVVDNLVASGVACWPKDLPQEVKDGLSKAEKKGLGL